MGKIPPQAKRVFKGVIFDIYQWQQQLYDGTAVTFEMAKRQPTVEVLALEGDTVVFTKQEQPGKPEYYSFLGGRGEEGEEPLATAKRELLEEAGLASEDWQLLREYQTVGKTDHPIYLFVAHNCRTIATPSLDAGEKVTLQRLPLADFISTIVPLPQFHGMEFKTEILSAFNPVVAKALCGEILGEKK